MAIYDVGTRVKIQYGVIVATSLVADAHRPICYVCYYACWWRGDGDEDASISRQRGYYSMYMLAGRRYDTAGALRSVAAT